MIRQYSLRPREFARFLAALADATGTRANRAEAIWLGVHLYSELEHGVVGIDGPASAILEESPEWTACTVDPIPVLQWPEPAIRWLPTDGAATLVEETTGQATQSVPKVAIGALADTLLDVDGILRPTYVFERHWGVVYANVPGPLREGRAINEQDLAQSSFLVYAWGFLLDEESVALVDDRRTSSVWTLEDDPDERWRESPVTIRIHYARDDQGAAGRSS